jgi:hypothetical protein
MADPYLINLSFQAASGGDADAVNAQVRAFAEGLKKSGQVLDFEVDFGRDWMAVPGPARTLRAAANRLLTEGPPGDEED